MAEYKVVDTEQLDTNLTGIADEVRTLVSTSEKMTIDEITSNIAQANTDVETQADLIAQIKTALEGKAVGGGDPYEVINSILDGTIIEFCSFSNVIGKQKTIGTLFNNCPNLTKWAMPNLTQGLSIAFRYCNNLTYIDIGRPTKCAANTFHNKPLEGVSVVIRTETMATLEGAFTGTSFDETTSFYVPKNLLETYKSATNWSAYAECFKAIEDEPEITGGII